MSEYDALVSGGAASEANEYDTLIRADAEQPRQKLRASMVGAVRQNPDQYGEAKQLERKLGVPAAVGVRNLPEVKLKADLNEFDTLLKTAPVLARSLQSADFASMSHDDIENLSQTEFVLGAQAEPRHAGGAIGGPAFQRHGVFKASEGPAPSVGSVAMGLLKSFPQGFEKAKLGMQQQAADAFGDEEGSAAATRLRRQVDFEQFLSTPKFDSSTAQGVYGGGASTLRVLPGAALSILTRNPAPVLGLMGAQTEAEAYGKYRERGATPGMAALGATAEGSTEVLTEMLPMGFLVSKFGKAGATQFLGGLLAREVPSEQVATLVQDAIDTSIANPTKTWGEYIAERPDAAYQTLLATVVQSGVMGAGHVAANKFSEGKARVEHAEQTGEALTQLAQLAKASKLRERDPQSFAQFIDAAAANGPVQDIYIDARMFSQAAGESLQAIAAASPAIAAQIEEAVSVGGDLVIPLGQYAASIAATDLNAALLPHLRTSADAMSMEEAKTFMQGEAEEFKKDTEKALEQHEFDSGLKESAATVEKELLAQLKTANRFTDDVNSIYAMPVAEFYTVQAARLNITPEEMYVKYPLNIQAESVAGENVMDQKPLRIYHGGDAKIKSIDQGKLQTRDSGFYGAGFYAAETPEGVKGYGNVVSAFDVAPTAKVLRASLKPEESPELARKVVAWLDTQGRERARARDKEDAFGWELEQVVSDPLAWKNAVDRYAEAQGFDIVRFASGEIVVKNTAALVPVAKAKEQAHTADSTPKEQTDGSGRDLDFTGTDQQPQELHTTVAGGNAAQGWASATSIRGASGPLAVHRGERSALTSDHFGVDALGYNSGNPTSAFGVFFSTSKAVAAKHGTVENYYLDIRNPKVIKADELPGFDSLEEAHAFRESLRKQGFDGMIISGKHLRDARVDIVAFDPAQVIYTAPPVANVLLQESKAVEPAPIFYSELQRKITDAKMNAAPAKAWKDYLKSLIGKGVKRDEIEASGIEEWLDLQEGKVTREQVTEFLQQNGVRVEERTMSGAATFEASFGDWQEEPDPEFLLEQADTYLEDAKQKIAERDDVPVAEVDEKEALDRAVGMARDSYYSGGMPQSRDIEVEANGKMYKFVANSDQGDFDLFAPADQGNELDALGAESILVSAGMRRQPDEAQIEAAIRSWLGEKLGIDFDEEGAPFADYTLPGGENYKVLLLTLPTEAASAVPAGQQTTAQHLRALSRQRKADAGTVFRSSHFDEPNILAHVRFNERTDADGKRVLFVEEFQSDWAQKGKKEGFAETKPQFRIFSKEHGAGGKPFDTEAEAQAAIPAFAKANSVEPFTLSVQPGTYTSDGVPSAPFVQKTEAWLSLAMKRMVRYAAENGFERIAWTTGEQQADRYSLSKSVTDIAWGPTARGIGLDTTEFDGARLVRIGLHGRHGFGDNLSVVVGKDGSVLQSNKKEGAVVGKKLDEVIGKAAAEKILSAPTGTLEGEGLKIGGEGMKAFYDRIVPNVANDVLKKLGGGRVGTVDLGRKDILGRASITERQIGGFTARVGDEAANFSTREDAAAWAKDRLGDNQPGFDITPEMKTKALVGLPLFQSNRGQISFGADLSKGSIITLLKNADLSTFQHELGHFYLEVLADIASQPAAPSEIVDDMRITLNWFKPGLTLEQWRAMSLEEKRPFHEDFARGNEAYWFEGKSPNTKMNAVFARFTAWMLHVYRNLLGADRSSENFQKQLAKAAGAEVRYLTPELRGVLDRLIATREQIKTAEQQRNMMPLFESMESAQKAGVSMTAAEWKAYHESDLAGSQAAIEQLQTRSLRDMQWLSNARSGILKRLQKNAAGRRKEVEAEVTAEVRAQPVYAAQRWLRHGEMVGPQGEEIKAEKGFRLDPEAIAEMYPEAMLARPDIAALRGMTGPQGLHPDLVAEMFGFTSGDHLVRAILEAQPESTVVEGMTDQRMLERYGDLSSPEALERAANEAIHNEARTKFIATGLRMLAKATGQKNILTKAAREFAATIIARKKLRDIRPAQFAAVEARAAKAVQKHLAGGKTLEAAVEQRNQLVNHLATKAAYDALEEIEKGVRYLKKIGDSKTVDPEYREQIAGLLDRFDLRKITGKEAERRKSLTQWIEAEREKNNEPVIDPELENEALRKPYADMTLEEFRGLVDSVRNIEHLGRLKHKLLTAKDEREFKERVDEAAASIEENAKRTVKPKLERNTWTDKMKDGVTEFFVMHRKFAAMIREMDGYKDGGILWELLSRPANASGAREAVMREQATMKLAELFKGLSNVKEKTFIPAINNSLSREGRIMVALNAGNEGNLQRMMDGDHWTPAQVRAVIDTLTKPEMDFVQSIWDFVGQYRSEIGAQQRRLTGVEPEWVEATEVVTRHGTYKGGYLPVKYDTTRSTRSLADEAAAGIMDQWRGARGRAKTRDSFTKARADKVVDRPIRKDLGVITQHVTEVTHRLAWQEFLVDAQRLLRASPIDNAIREHYGHEVLEALRDTIEDIAAGEQPAQNAFERGVNYLRTGATIAGLGWRVTTSLLQPFGLTQSMVRIGPKYVARGMAEWLGDSVRMENTVKRIYEKWPEMRLRGKTMQREISEIQNLVENRNSAIKASYFYLIQKMQIVADVPTLLGAYHKAIEENRDEDTARAMAWQAVLDAQGGGQLKDLAAIQRGGPLLKLFTNFYSFFSTTYNLTTEAVGRTNFKSPLAVGYLAVDMLLLYSVPAALGTLLKAALSGGEDGEEKLWRKLIADQLTYLFGTMVGLRELAGGIQTAAGVPGDYQGPASVRLFAEMAKFGKQAGQGEVDEALLKAMNNVGGILLHYPSGQINATADGLYSLANGKTENPGALLVGSNKR